MNPRKAMTIAFFAALLGIGYVSMNAAPVLSGEGYSYHGETRWQTDYADAVETAAAEDEPVVIYFWTTWCTYCEDYNQNHYSDPAVRSELDEFTKVAVNLDSDAEADARLQQRYNVNYPPQHVVVTPEGDVLTRIPGYAPPEDFLAYLETARERYQDGETADNGSVTTAATGPTSTPRAASAMTTEAAQ
ncbi:thioredoxin family protein [Halobellus limi]|jgi:thioredoxin-related protein|uniref:Thioredoxin-related protein n=2 Tax=Halobellus limi TaxID=699433 RepID=A0A1H5WGJ0_9EURY|nr:thioredoxin fold domain-containing protein [Halobellus limi]SEF98594.1 Thioredoxin-related protein [Halobellus limi]